MAAAVRDLFFSNVNRTDTCWLWRGTILQNGYSRLTVAGQPVYGHRLSHELFIGPIPDGLEIDHLCRVRNCVNPAHLEAVTHTENIRRAQPYRAARRAEHPPTHCRRGHEYVVNAVGNFVCRPCERARNRRKYLASKARAAA